MKSVSSKVLRTALVLLVLLGFFFTLCGCVATPGVRRRTKKINPSNFPNTVWTCKEIDMVLYMIEGSMKDVVGTYTVNEKEYYLDAQYGPYTSVGFYVYSYSEKTVSENDPSLVRYKASFAGFFGGKMDYEDETGNLIVKVSNYEQNDASLPETFPEKLTFEKTGTFGKTPNTRWVAEELDLYLDSFSDTDKYYVGEIKIDGEPYRVYARDDGKYFQLVLIERKETSQQVFSIRHELVCLSFAVSDEEIVATRVEGDFSEKYWNPDVKTITFHPAPIE